VRGITSGRTYVAVEVRKVQQRTEAFSPMITPRLPARQGFGFPTKGAHQRAQQHPSQTQNSWIHQKRSEPTHRKLSSNAHPTLRPAATGR